MRPVHPKVPNEAEATIGPVMLAGRQQATTCPFDLNAWRILHPPKRSVNAPFADYSFNRNSRTTVASYGGVRPIAGYSARIIWRPGPELNRCVRFCSSLAEVQACPTFGDGPITSGHIFPNWSNNGPVTFNHGVEGSSPSALTKNLNVINELLSIRKCLERKVPL